MTKMDLFSTQTQRLESRLSATPIREASETHKMNKEKETSATGKAVTPYSNDNDEDETEWSNDFATSPANFNEIITDADSKKRLSGASSLSKAKKAKSQLSSITRSRALGHN